jgi:hypothetical protein
MRKRKQSKTTSPGKGRKNHGRYSNELMLHDFYVWVDRMTLKGPAE